jgi:hypothetical protein
VELILPFRLALLAIVFGPAIVCAQTFEVPRVEVGGHAGWIGAVGECLCALPIVGPRVTINLSQQNAVEVLVGTLTPASPATYGFYFVQYKHTARRSSGQAAIRPFYTAGTGGYYNHRRIPEGRETRPDGSVVIYPAHSTGEVSRLNIATFGGGIERDLSRYASLRLEGGAFTVLDSDEGFLAYRVLAGISVPIGGYRGDTIK